MYIKFITSNYINITKYAGASVIGSDIPHTSKTLLYDVHFHPFTFKVGSLNITVFSIVICQTIKQS